MATSKSGSSSKKSTAKKSTRSATTTKVTTVKAATTAPQKKTVFTQANGAPNYPAIIIAEVIGTFILTVVALSAVQYVTPLFVGLTVAVLVLGIGAVSGAHLNPAVTFGLWSARRLKSVLLPVYWVAQFAGALLALILLGVLSGKGIALDFGHFATINFNVLLIEAIATAVFLFGILAVTSSDSLKATGKAFGIGLSLTVAILISITGFNSFRSGIDTSSIDASSIDSIPRAYIVDGATINPAVALAASEKTLSQLTGSASADSEEKQYTRLGFEVIIGTLVGAALGANLYLLLAYMQRQKS